MFQPPQLFPDPAGQRGQVTVLVAVLVAVMVGAAVAVSFIAAAMIDRSSVTAAADAVALAGAVDPAAGDSLAAWYRDRGVAVDVQGGRARAEGERAVARSHAVVSEELSVAPVIRAVVARAEQLLGRSLVVVGAEGVDVTFDAASASHFAAVAAELAMCPTDATSFARC